VSTGARPAHAVSTPDSRKKSRGGGEAGDAGLKAGSLKGLAGVGWLPRAHAFQSSRNP